MHALNNSLPIVVTTASQEKQVNPNEFKADVLAYLKIADPTIHDLSDRTITLELAHSAEEALVKKYCIKLLDFVPKKYLQARSVLTNIEKSELIFNMPDFSVLRKAVRDLRKYLYNSLMVLTTFELKVLAIHVDKVCKPKDFDLLLDMAIAAQEPRTKVIKKLTRQLLMQGDVASLIELSPKIGNSNPREQMVKAIILGNHTQEALKYIPRLLTRPSGFQLLVSIVTQLSEKKLFDEAINAIMILPDYSGNLVVRFNKFALNDSDFVETGLKLLEETFIVDMESLQKAAITLFKSGKVERAIEVGLRISDKRKKEALFNYLGAEALYGEKNPYFAQLIVDGIRSNLPELAHTIGRLLVTQKLL